MKLIESFVLRGQMTGSATEPHRVHLYQGEYSYGFRVKSFHMSWAKRDAASQVSINGLIATEEGMDPERWNWGDPRELAWCMVVEDGNYPATRTPFELADPENLAVEDLFIYAYVYGDLAEPVNYLIELEKYELKPYQGSLTIVNNMSQG